jgi:hypothetical protein
VFEWFAGARGDPENGAKLAVFAEPYLFLCSGLPFFDHRFGIRA